MLAQQKKISKSWKAKYTDWSHRDDIKAKLKLDLIMLLAQFKYPPVTRYEVYKGIFTQAENFKKNRVMQGSSLMEDSIVNTLNCRNIMIFKLSAIVSLSSYLLRSVNIAMQYNTYGLIIELSECNIVFNIRHHP